MSEIVAFGPKAAERVQAVVKRVEATIYPTSQPQSKRPVIGGTALQYVEGIVTNTITAFNSNTNTYGSGTVECYRPSLNASTNSYMAIIDPSFGVNGSVTCYNFSANSGTINTNAHVGMMQRNTANGSLIFELIWGC